MTVEASHRQQKREITVSYAAIVFSTGVGIQHLSACRSSLSSIIHSRTIDFLEGLRLTDAVQERHSDDY